MSAGAAGSWQLSNLAPRMARGDFAPGFMIDLQVKDLNLVLEAAADAGLYLTGTHQAHALFSDGQKNGRGRDGTQALFPLVERQAKAFHQFVEKSLAEHGEQ